MKTSKAHPTHRWRLRIVTGVVVAFIVIIGTRMTFSAIQRCVLQRRAARFVATQTPRMLSVGSVKLYGLQPNKECLSAPRAIISHYAQLGMLNMSAANQCRMALAHLETGLCLSAVETNQEAKAYVVECQTILDRIGQLEYYRAWIKNDAEQGGGEERR